MNTDERACPWCAETIKAAAVVCRFCQRDVSAPQGVQVQRESAGGAGVMQVEPAPQVHQPTALDVAGRTMGLVALLIVVAPGLWAITGGVRKELFPEVITAADMPPAPAPAPAPTASFQSLLAAIWKNFDDLPAEQKDKAALGRAATASGALVRRVPSDQFDAASGLAAEAFRKRAAPLVNPHTHSAGEHDTTLVPSDTLAECLVWGSQWSKGETAATLRDMGFASILCGNGRRWGL